MARSLLFEARAQASDRTKTKEERAADEFENMKEKEEERKKRARGDYDHGEDEGKCSKRRRSSCNYRQNNFYWFISILLSSLKSQLSNKPNQYY